ncbi:hypothetical protein RND81_07G106900 [Saponaria officinalis]|uniref:C3H1-type domain-containing protein n=1 Tax=Saponaria officinalis TaxID=3572 RepID=A0AAW1JQL1_SAPOF
MDEEFMKRCTDCVYFLASPFTCKKGVECEYRHSETARLNPRDCWYWLSGTCSNFNCRFRHPPLDVHNEGSTEAAAPLPNQSTVPATKTTVPCYYYLNGFCNKGDRCPFLHEPGYTFAWNSKVGNSVSNASVPSSVSKSSIRSDTGPKHAEKHSSPLEMGMISCNGSQLELQLPAQQTFIENVQNQNTYVQTYSPECEETAAVEAVSLQPSDDSPKSESPPNFGSDQSSEEPIEGNAVRDEWWESSPGFDVLVDGQTHDLSYDEDDLEYIHPHIGSDEDPDPVFVQYGFDADCNDSGFFSNGLYEQSEHLDSELIVNHGSFSPRCPPNRNFRRNNLRKRKFCSVESPDGGCDIVDLRDHLRRKRMIDCYLGTHDLRHDLVQRRYDSPERFVSHHPNHHLHGRLASRVERNGVGLDRQRTAVAATGFRGRPKNPQRRHNSLALGQPRSLLKREKHAPKLTKVAKPRNFADTDNDKKQGYHSKTVSVDFEGPKPLSEILKEKKKTIFAEDGTMTGCF